MRKTARLALCVMLCLCTALIAGISASACTTVIVGEEASEDGSAYFFHTVDSSGLMNTCVMTVAASDEKGTWVYTDPDSGFSIRLPKAGCRYTITPVLFEDSDAMYASAGENEFGVCISATETLRANEAALKADPYVKRGIAESNIPQLILPYVTSAREGVQALGNLVEVYGSTESNGIVIGDSNEIWYFEVYTGHQWAAVRCPKDCYAVIPNDAILGYLDLSDPENCLASADIYTLPEKEGFLQCVDGKPHLAATYNMELRDYSQIRLWAGRRWFSPSVAGDYDVNKRYSIFAKPDEKISLADLMEFTRYRLEDTKYSCDLPGNNYRPVGIERTANTTIFQVRSGKPTVMWVETANPEFSIYIPMYGNLDTVPECVSLETKADRYTEKSLYWQIRAVSSLATLDRGKYGATVRDTLRAMELEYIRDLAEMDSAFEAAGETPEKASQLLAAKCDEVKDAVQELRDTLLTRISQNAVERSSHFGHDLDN